MGDPRSIKKKYSGPGHPWQKARLEEEKSLKSEYRLKNKKEIYKVESKVKSFAAQAKKLIASRTQQSEKETKQLIARLARLGLLPTDAKLDDVLNLKTRDLLERRLQTILFRKGFARTMSQARQFIVHQHVMVKDRTIDVPGYIVPLTEESTIQFVQKSTLSNQEHPERVLIERPKKEEKKEERKPRKPVKRAPKKAPRKTKEAKK